MDNLFPARLPYAVSLARQIACASRELYMRQRVYPGLVRKGRMLEVDAEDEIACMTAILDTLRAMLEAMQEEARNGRPKPGPCP